jgi:hypothetical protein
MSTAEVSVDVVARDGKHWVFRAQCFLSPDCLLALAPVISQQSGLVYTAVQFNRYFLFLL